MPSSEPQRLAAGCMQIPINYGDTVFSNIDANDCVANSRLTDEYTFNGIAGQQINITFDSGQFSPFLELYSSSGTLLATGIFFQFTRQITVTLPSTDLYVIRASSSGQKFTHRHIVGGFYNLSSAQGASACIYNTGGPVGPSAGRTVGIGLGFGGGSTNFTINTNSPTCSWTTATNVPWLTINGSASGSGDGNINFSISNNATGGPRRGDVITAGLAVYIYQDSNTPCSSTAIGFGQILGDFSASDCTDFGEYVDEYTFNGTAGEKIDIITDPMSLTPGSVGLRLFQPNGNNNFFGSVVSDYVLPETGTYRIRASANDGFDQPNGTGTYRLRLGSVPSNGITVTNTNDSGTGSLRQAIVNANSNPDANEIRFSIAGAAPHTINLLSALPSLTNPVTIDATTQPGFAGTPIVELNGTNAGNNAGFFISASNCSVKGFVINRFNNHGVFIGGNNNIIRGNYIGTNTTGTATLPVTFSGIFITGNGNLIGGITSADRNVLSGNGHQGIATKGSGNIIKGNFIGTDASGANGLGGGGIFVFAGASNNLIGGPEAGARNVISGNDSSNGIDINTFETAGATGNVVQGNYIGTDAAGTVTIPNKFDGVNINGVSGNSVRGNLVSGNNGSGINIHNGANNNTIEGNLVGTNASGTAAIRNQIQGVSINSNSGNNTVGGLTPAQRNLISGNASAGVALGNNPGPNNLIIGNYIGTDLNGNNSIPNGGGGVVLGGGTSGSFVGGAASGSGNIIAGNSGNGVTINGSNTTGNTIAGNFIGTDVSGNAALSNGGNGVHILDASNNTIGGTAAGARNVISGNGGQGVNIQRTSSNNVVQGNFIGTNLAGTTALPNARSGMIIFDGATNNTVGGTASGAANVISGNATQGIFIGGTGTPGSSGTGTGTASNVVQGNLIGTNFSGTAAIGNSNGIIVFNSPNNTIGGSSSLARNVISGNTAAGIFVQGAESSNNTIVGNFVGIDISGNPRVPNSGNGIAIVSSASGNIIQGNTVSGNNVNGIIIASGVATINNQIRGNRIGTNASGTAAVANTFSGIDISTPGNIVGGTTPADRNVISGNQGSGLTISGANNVVQGNYIGTNASGNVAIKNSGGGVSIFAPASNNFIGGSGSGQRNVISGNETVGLSIQSAGAVPGPASGNRIQGNYIGVAADGVTPLGNTAGSQLGWGIAILRLASNNVIGGAAPNEGNIVAHNAGPGLAITTGGTPAGSTSGNQIRGNAFFSNGGLAIDLEQDGVTQNDTNDSDNGPNGFQNFPLLNSANSVAGQTAIGGTLNSVPNTAFTVEFFSNAACDASGNGEGQTFIGTSTVTTNAAGNVTIVSNFAVALSSGQFVTATATNKTTNDTSEFSPCVAVTSDDAFPLITGRVTGGPNLTPVPGITVTLTGTSTASTTTDNNGNYSFANLQLGGNYAVTPSSPTLFFAPANRVFNNLTANQPGSDFTATPLSVPAKADYQFDGSLNASGGSAPALTNLTGGGANSFVNDVIDGYTARLFASRRTAV